MRMNLSLNRSTTLLLCLFALSACSSNKPHYSEEVIVAETVYTFDELHPANMAISSDGRVFVTGHPIVNSTTKVVEVLEDGQQVVYPNDTYSNSIEDPSVIGATIGVHVDSQDNLWVLDMANSQLVVWDIHSNGLVRIIKLPPEVLLEQSFLQDFVLDEKHNRVIIADMTQGDLVSPPEPAFVVVDLNQNMAYRVAKNHPSMLPDIADGLALNPITIDPDYNYVYFGAMNGKKIYRINTEAFADPATVGQNIEYYAPKPYSDGIKVDDNGNVYITDIEHQAIGVSNPDSGYQIVATLPNGQTWPDGMFIKDGVVYVVVNQLNRTAALNNGVDETQGEFIIVKIPEIAP